MKEKVQLDRGVVRKLKKEKPTHLETNDYKGVLGFGLLIDAAFLCICLFIHMM